ncbi:MAG: sigma 54-interacting transcriptional regulator [Bacteroidota bacterium]
MELLLHWFTAPETRAKTPALLHSSGWYIISNTPHHVYARSHSTPQGQTPVDALGEIAGTSAFAQDLREVVQTVSKTGEHIIISGDPGTGKRFIASVINTLTFRKSPGNLVGIAPQTHEDEVRAILFEEERRRIEGMLGRPVAVLGSRGTLVIRNVYEFSIIGQTRVARFLIQQESHATTKPSQLRVIFLVPSGWTPKSRQRAVIDSLDQYLRGFRQIVLKPLRTRPEDVPSLVEHFLRSLLGPNGKLPTVDEETMKQLTNHAWHDNVRELKIVVGEGLSRSSDGVFVLPDSFIDEVALVEGILKNILSGKKGKLELVLNELERALLRRALVRAENDRLKSAQLLSVSDLNLRYRLRKFRLQDIPIEQPGKPDDIPEQ